MLDSCDLHSLDLVKRLKYLRNQLLQSWSSHFIQRREQGNQVYFGPLKYGGHTKVDQIQYLYYQVIGVNHSQTHQMSPLECLLKYIN